MKILNRYVLKEHVGPLVFALASLTSLLLLNYIAKQFGNLVGKGLPWSVIGEFFVLSIPFTIAMTLPMAVLVSTLYAFSRLASENEITALKASGVSMTRVITPVLLGATVVALWMVWFNDQVLPRANHKLRTLQSDIARKKPTIALRAQVINEVSPGKFFLRANHLDESSNRMREVTIYDLSDPTRRRTIYADSGNMGLAPNRADLELTLYHGNMQEISRTDPSQLQRLFYVVDLIRVRGVGNDLERSGASDTYKSNREMSICEMQTARDRAEIETRRAQMAMEQMFVNNVHAVITGGVVPMTKVPEPKNSLRLGTIYCDLLGHFFAVDSAEAAELPAQIQDTTRKPKPATTKAPPARFTLPQAQLPGMDTSRIRAGGAPPPAPALPLNDPRAIAARNKAHADSVRRALLAARPGMPRNIALSGSLTSLTLENEKARIEDNARVQADLDVEIEKKFALAAACVVFVLLGAPVALRFPRGGVGLTIGVSLGVFGLYYVGLIAGQSLADRGMLSPFFAMWATNILFTIIGLVLLARMGREGSTSRGGDAGEMMDAFKTWFAKQARRVGVPLERRRNR